MRERLKLIVYRPKTHTQKKVEHINSLPHSIGGDNQSNNEKNKTKQKW